ncbi:MAG: 5'-methylthioadenosine/adenosylhomocysteine nucleosidase [Lachnospiraceae bacterium]|nr:5'-methylthioadenosine/adenosylhomocysteine nucleosidase [Lachnospiraceae bacterium]
MLGIIGAMDEEVAKIKEQMDDVNVTAMAAMDFYEGSIHGYPVVVVRSGIGKVNAAMCTQILAVKYKADAIINTGIAGSLDARIDIGDIVLSTDTLEHDMDAVAFGYPVGQIPRMDTLSFTADDDLRKLAREVCQNVNPDISVFEGRVVSGDQFISDKDKKNWLVETFKGSCTEMEGAAIGHAAYLNNIPFLIIRAISDKADDSASVDYPAFEAKAIDHSVRLLLGICEKLNKS